MPAYVYGPERRLRFLSSGKPVRHKSSAGRLLPRDLYKPAAFNPPRTGERTPFICCRRYDESSVFRSVAVLYARKAPMSNHLKGAIFVNTAQEFCRKAQKRTGYFSQFKEKSVRIRRKVFLVFFHKIRYPYSVSLLFFSLFPL